MNHVCGFIFTEPCSIQESQRLRNLLGSIHTSQRWSSALTSHLMRFVMTQINLICTQCPVFCSPRVWLCHVFFCRMDLIICWPTVTTLKLSFPGTVWAGWCQAVSSFHWVGVLKFAYKNNYFALLINCLFPRYWINTDIKQQILTFEKVELTNVAFVLAVPFRFMSIFVLWINFSPHTFLVGKIQVWIFYPDNKNTVFAVGRYAWFPGEAA